MADCSICTFLVIVYIIVVEGQRFVETPSLYQEVKTGDDVHLRCTVDVRGQCFWLKDQRPVVAQQGKYEWTGDAITDCTLLIRQATVHQDDGSWMCHHVRFNDLFRQDTLSSKPSQLVVILKPRKPILEHEGLPLGTAFTLREGQKVTISCVSKYGNPPALLQWYIGNNRIESLENQSNTPEMDDRNKTSMARSVLQVRARKDYHGLPIRCLAAHPASATPASTESRLNIQYVPEVQLVTSPELLTTVPEDLVSIFKFKCLVDANPAVSVKWYRDSVPIGESSLDATAPAVSLIQSRTKQVNDTTWSAEIFFEPVKRYDAGLYTCKATNKVGESAPASYRLDVQYGPKLKKDDSYNVTGKVEETALLGSAVESFNCPEFEANPPAQYRWVHLHGSPTGAIEVHIQNKGDGRRLRLENVTWSNEGEYRCIAFNTINGFKRELASDMRFVLYVTGPPTIQVRPLTDDKNFRESFGRAGEPVHRLKSRFCSRPPPKLVAWQWGSSQIRAGENIPPKYEALPLEPIVEYKMATNCYWAKLDIKDLQKGDARIYTLLVESEKGRDSTSIRLIVKDSTEMRVTAAVVAVALLILLALISVGVYLLLRIRRRRYRQKIVEESSIAVDAPYGNGATVDRQKSINLSHVQTIARKSSLDSSQDAYQYTNIARPKSAMSPEALKVRRAPMVLQPPTKV